MSNQTYKQDRGKLRMDLLPPLAHARICRVYETGLTKYPSPFSWRGNVPKSKMLAAIMRHLALIFAGEEIDPESGCSHMAHLAAEACMYLDEPEVMDVDRVRMVREEVYGGK